MCALLRVTVCFHGARSVLQKETSQWAGHGGLSETVFCLVPFEVFLFRCCFDSQAWESSQLCPFCLSLLSFWASGSDFYRDSSVSCMGEGVFPSLSRWCSLKPQVVQWPLHEEPGLAASCPAGGESGPCGWTSVLHTPSGCPPEVLRTSVSWALRSLLALGPTPHVSE